MTQPVPEPGPRRPLVVVAEKNPRIRQFLAREFAARGWLAVQAADGAELRRAARAEPRPDMFVVDLELPFLEEGLRGPGGEALRPLVLHALMPEAADHPALPLAGAVVEKTGDPGALLDAAWTLLQRAPGPDPQ
ncbi:response regulator transcription factor [Desulfocurvus vexinensis]|uniref:response regulator transcription factor n=1 Tax=Desulfocurvus vexinensis TaxID=399548 RepID=UPI0004909A4A|nr:response regulator transcription factor [Desulfocurvus vexinensis]